MSRIYRLREDDRGDDLYRRIYLLIIKNRLTWQSVGATLGISGGMFSLLLAMLLWSIVRFLAASGSASILRALEIIFFVLPLPLLALGVHCLDLLEKKRPALTLPGRSQSAEVERWLPLRPRHPHHN